MSEPQLCPQQSPANSSGQLSPGPACLNSSHNEQLQPLQPQPTTQAKAPRRVVKPSRKQVQEPEQQQPQLGTPPKPTCPIRLLSSQDLESPDPLPEATEPPGSPKDQQRQSPRRSPPHPGSPDGKRSSPLLKPTPSKGPKVRCRRRSSKGPGSSSIPSLSVLLARAEKQMQRSVSSPQLQNYPTGGQQYFRLPSDLVGAVDSLTVCVR